jgi:DNA-binding XRE family transcriptional regulator
LGITQEQLAKKVGTYKSNISVIESGKIKRSKYIDLICAELQISC